MHFSQIAALIATTLTATSLAAPLSPRNEVVYATFYDDNACTQNGGEAVSVSNPGCLNESGRQSIYFQAGFDDADVYLVESSAANCPCQDNCDYIALDTYNSDPFCYSIDLTAWNSYRFETGTECPANNC